MGAYQCILEAKDDEEARVRLQQRIPDASNISMNIINRRTIDGLYAYRITFDSAKDVKKFNKESEFNERFK